MEINKDMLKIKHIINIDTEAATDAEDFLYAAIQAYDEKSWDPYTRGATIPQLKWAGLNKTIGNSTIEESLATLIDMEYMEIRQANGADYYIILKHPWN